MDKECDLSEINNSENFLIKGKISKKALKKLIRKKKELEKKMHLEDAIVTDDNVSLLKTKSDLTLEKNLQETSYYFENGLRKVYPYFFKYSANAKGRWFNKKIVDVFCSEIQGYTNERCNKILEKGLLKVNGKNVDANYIIKNGDVIHNYVHRHELPVTDEKIRIMFEDEAVLVINKPSSIPMHPCGRYRHNSLLYILAKENGYKRLHTIHRIDRLTSGLVILCKNEYKAKKMAKCIVDRIVTKEYVCKVEGRFPSGIIECAEPIGVMCSKNGIFQVHPNGKYSKTVFEVLTTDGITSIVKCKPLTGRTHQIRVHLQYLGFPIVNDPLYNNYAWGALKGKGGCFDKSEQEIIQDLMKIHSSNLYLSDDISNSMEIKFNSNYSKQTIDSTTQNISNKISENNLEPISMISSQLSWTSKNHLECTSVDSQCDINIKTKLSKNSLTLNEKISEDEAILNVPIKKQRINSDSDFIEESPLATNEILLNYYTNESQTKIQQPVNEFNNSNKQNIQLNVNIVQDLYDKDCLECQKVYKDPTKEQLSMYLHAVKYESLDWSYSTPLPDWAC